MPQPTAALQTLRTATAALTKDLSERQWSDAEAHAPSLLPGWTRGHVLTHLARNADGIAATLAGALRGEVVERYPDGWAARDQDIEDGSSRPVATLLADVTESAERLDRVLAAVEDADAWEATTEHDQPAAAWPSLRLREVEIHRVDLGTGYHPSQWPPGLVGPLLPHVAETLAERAPSALHVVVRADDLVVGDLAGREWRVAGDGEPVEAAGPDWALLAWLVGRGAVVADSLTAVPPLSPWR